VADELRVPFADHMLVAVPADVPPLRVAAASDNLADAWRSVVTPLRDRPGGSVLIIGGGAKSIGLYAAGLAVAHGAAVVHYVDDDPRVAGSPRHSARTASPQAHVRAAARPRRSATTSSSRRRLAQPGCGARSGRSPEAASAPPSATTSPREPGCHSCTCTPPTRRSESVSRMHERCSPTCSPSSHAPATPAELVTTLTAHWDDAPTAYAARTTKLVLQRDADARLSALGHG